MSEPRTWDVKLPPEPEGVKAVRDCDGDVWHRLGDGVDGGQWGTNPDGWGWSCWRDLLTYAPLTEVIED